MNKEQQQKMKIEKNGELRMKNEKKIEILEENIFYSQKSKKYRIF